MKIRLEKYHNKQIIILRDNPGLSWNCTKILKLKYIYVEYLIKLYEN